MSNDKFLSPRETCEKALNILSFFVACLTEMISLTKSENNCDEIEILSSLATGYKKKINPVLLIS